MQCKSKTFEKLNEKFKNFQIENSKRTGILQLSKNNLNEFSDHILEVDNKLRSIDVSHNNLQTSINYQSNKAFVSKQKSNKLFATRNREFKKL